MKIAVFTAMPSMHLWHDGLYDALQLLMQDYEVEIFLNHRRPDDITDFDFALAWGGLTSKEAIYLASLPIKKGLLFGASHGHQEPLVHKFDIVFVEDKYSLKKFQGMGVNAHLAFGTSVELFQPIAEQSIFFDAINVGAYAIWKRKELFAKALSGTKLKGVSVGELQKVEREQFTVCQKAGILTLPNVSQEFMPYYYASAKCVVITGWAGGQRTVLEALAMNKPCIVVSDAPHLLDYSDNITIVDPEPEAITEAIKEASYFNIRGRRDILNNWTENHYYRYLKKGIDQCLK